MPVEQALVLGSLTLAIIMVVGRARSIENIDLNKLLALPKWDFSTSWASTFVVLAAFIGILVSASKLVVPEPPHFMKFGTYIVLFLAFGLVATAAPFLYRALSSATKSGELAGTVGLFLVCTALTLWAAFGQLLAAILLVWEAQPSAIEPSSAAALTIPLGLTGIALIPYVLRAIKSTIDAAPGPQTLDVDQALPRWTLL